jgi:hypothetical protein
MSTPLLCQRVQPDPRVFPDLLMRRKPISLPPSGNSTICILIFDAQQSAFILAA